MKKIMLFLLGLFISLLIAKPVHAAPPANFQTSLVIGSGLTGPSGFEIAPDGRIFILQRTGEIFIYKNGQLLSQPFAVLPSVATGDRGMIGITFDPNFLSNHFVYFYYTSTDLMNYLVRFNASGDVGTDGPVILYQTHDPSEQFHVGGTIAFGPDGKLYISIGDNGYPPNSQDLSNAHGKILRINPDGSIPLDNPFVGQPNVLPEIWAYGFRNPFRFVFDKTTGNMYEGDVGEATTEEINHIVKGGNYGWPTCEGPCPLGFINPIYSYLHNGLSSAVALGPVYHGSMFPAQYQGRVFFGDYAQGFIKTLGLDANGNMTDVQNFDSNAGSVVELRVAPDGSLYYLTYIPGRLYRVTFSTTNSVPVATASVDTTKGLAPLTAHFSSTGSNSPTGAPITYRWDFGDGTTSSDPNPTKTYNTNGTFLVELHVSDGQNNALSIPIIMQVGTPPVLTIGAPTDGMTYKAGDVIHYSSSAVDGAGFDLPDSAYATNIVFHHLTHIHPFIGPLAGVKQGTFTTSMTGESSPVTWYEIQITATDTNGLSTTKSVNIYPILSSFTMTSQPTGTQTLVDGQPTASPTTIQGVVNFRRELGVQTLQNVNNQWYQFDHWSDGGLAKHFILTPDTTATYSATFTPFTPYQAQYYPNSTLSGTPTVTRQEPFIDFAWNDGTNNGSPDPSIPGNAFSARFTKTQYFATGRYDIQATADDGVRVYLDGNLVIDQWHDEGTTTYHYIADLSQGNHTIVMEYYQNGGGAVAKLTWDLTPDQPLEIVPTLTPTPSPTPAPGTFLGGMNLDGYCKNNGQTGASLVNNVWVCVPGGAPITLTNACQWQYIPTAVALQDRQNDPYSWSCYQGSAPTPTPTATATPTPTPTSIPTPTPTPVAGARLGGMNLDGYCLSQKFSGSALVTGNWTCVPSNPPATINMTAACQWQYVPNAVAQQDVPNNPYTWACYTTSTTQTPTPTPVNQTTYTGTYWNTPGATSAPATPSATPDLTRQDAAISFNWDVTSPDPKINHDHYVVQWTKTSDYAQGTYQLQTESDDGIRVFVDDQKVIDDWTDHSMTTDTASIGLPAGSHTLKIQYYQDTGGAVAAFTIQKTADTITTPTPTPVVNPTPTPTVATSLLLGGMDLDGYCKSTGQTGTVLLNNIWNCTPSNTAIPMDSACQWQYKSTTAKAKQSDTTNPFTWACYSQ